MAPETAANLRGETACIGHVSDCRCIPAPAETPRNCATCRTHSRECPARGRYSGLPGAVEKTRTSTGFRPQRPQRCASTNSATTAKSVRFETIEPGGRSGPLAKGYRCCKRRSAISSGRRNKRAQPGFQPISAATADLGTSVTASLIVTLSPGARRRLGGMTSQL